MRRDGKVALGGDGQVTVGDTVMKANAQKVRMLRGVRLLAGFAGAAADADHWALAWHTFLWDPWFLLWGVMLGLALWRFVRSDVE